MAPKAAEGVAVAATDRLFRACVVALGLAGVVRAGVLPDDRGDVLFHAYDGGGVQVSGPSVQVLKKFDEKVTLSGNYYVDAISSASIDVVTTASPYKERREEYGVSTSLLQDNVTMNLSYGNSEESDYSARFGGFGIAMDMFGNMTRVSLGWGGGADEVRRNGDEDFREKASHQNYRLGLSQVLTRDLVLDIAYEAVTDEGYLNNPYRTVRYLDGSGSVGRQEERYPRTRTSNALAIRPRLYLPHRAALYGEYRYYDDTWGIRAHNGLVGYVHPFGKRWLLDFRYRYYTQRKADFYSDLFPYYNAQNYLARDKELSTFRDHSLGFKLSWEFGRDDSRLLERGTLNLGYDYIYFLYDDFRDLRKTGYAPGEEPLYRFDAHVLQLYMSLWY